MTGGRSEEGALAVVLAIMTVIALFATVLVTGVAGDISNVDSAANIQQARALAQAGVSDALFRIDQMGGTTSSFCVGPAPQCTVASVPGAPGVEYAARVDPADPNTFTVSSQGVYAGKRYAVKATVSRVPAYPTAVFASSGITIEGSSSNINVVDQYGNVVDGADLGSDGVITCHGSGTYGKQQITYGSGQDQSCPNWTDSTIIYAPQQPLASCPAPLPPSSPPTPCMASPAQACPGIESGGTWTIDGSTSPVTLEPGVYDCVGNLTVLGTVNVDTSSPVNGGKVQLFLFPPANSSSVAVDLSSAILNPWESAPPASPAVTGNPTALQLYIGGSGSLGLVGANAHAVLYAPGMDATLDSGAVNWTGALVLNSLRLNGGPNMTINYDQRMVQLLQSGWQVSNFQQLPWSSFSLALS